MGTRLYVDGIIAQQLAIDERAAGSDPQQRRLNQSPK